MRIPRFLTWLVVTVVVAGVGVTMWNAWRSYPTSGAPGQSGWVSTEWGPVGPGDRDMVIRIRLAGLWEHPVGQQMVTRATMPRVREIGGLISTEHLALDKLTTDTATTLGIDLPNQPTEQQSGWMAQISAQSGSNYDTTAVNLLRQAHGTVLPLLAAVRANTRNSVIRELADNATQYVRRHIGYLESTGIVDFDALPPPPEPAQAVVTRGGDYQQIPVALTAFGIVLAMGAVIAFTAVMIRRTRRTAEPRHATDPDPADDYDDEPPPTAPAGNPRVNGAWVQPVPPAGPRHRR